MRGLSTSKNLIALGCWVTFSLFTLSSNTGAAEEHLSVKDIKIVFGTSAGGSYGLYSLLVARYLQEHLPGNPNIIAESMPGAGGLVAMNWLFDVATRDGSVLAIVRAESVFESLLNEDSRIDATAFSWIGRLTDLKFIGVASRRSGIRTLDDAKGRTIVAGAADLKGISATAPTMYNRLIDTKFRIVAGYAGSARIFQAMEQGELDFFAMSWTALQTAHRSKFESGQVRPVFAYTENRIDALPDVPAVYEFIKTPAEKLYLNIFLSSSWIGRTLIAPPGMSDELVAILRAAFEDMLEDPEFLQEVEDRGIMLNPMSGIELESRIGKLRDIPREEIDTARGVYDDLLKRAKE